MLTKENPETFFIGKMVLATVIGMKFSSSYFSKLSSVIPEHRAKVHDIRIYNKSFGNVKKFRYLRMVLTSQNYIHDDIKSRFKLESACLYSFENLFMFPCPVILFYINAFSFILL
jgi:hypothetical protein